MSDLDNIPKKSFNWQKILLLANSVVVVFVLIVTVRHLPMLETIKENIEENERQREAANKPKDVNISEAQLATHAALGSSDAKATLIKFNSFSCGYCRLSAQVLKQLRDKYKDNLRIVYMHFNRGGQDEVTSQAVECAGDQGKFWEFYFGMFDKQVSGDDSMYSMASSVGVNAGKLKACVQSKKYLTKVRQDSQFGQQIGVTGTPAFVLNNQLVSGHRPMQYWDAQIAAKMSN